MTTLTFNTEKTFTNITQDVQKLIPKGFNGLVHVFSQHTTCCVRLLEDEILLKSDYCVFLEKMASKDGHFRHDIVGIRDVPVHERINGFAHIQALFFPTSETIPVIDGVLAIGLWQQICLVELDGARNRNVIVTLIAEAK